MYWLYRGLRRGLYPALNVFLVFFLPLLITLNYYDLLFDLVGKMAPESSPTTRETIAFVGTYALSFTFFLYFCLWLCIDVMRLNKIVDAVGGAICGIATGVVCCGVLLLVWFSMPFARRQFPVDDTELFFRAHDWTLRAVTFVAHRIQADRPFSGERFLRDLRYGLPQIPSVGEGYYVASIPNGLRVFIDATGAEPADFLNKIKGRLANPDQEIPPSEKRLPWGERSRTPIFIGQGGETGSALIGVIMERVPEEIGGVMSDPAKMFVHDGEVYYARENISDRVLFIKIYKVEKQGPIGSVIALFQPQDEKLAQELVPTFLPTRECFRFDEEQMMTRLMEAGATHEEAQALIPRLKLGGKVWFRGRGNKPTVAEITGDNKWRIFEAVAPEIKEPQKDANQPRP